MNRGARTREGDFIETTNGLIFDVKGLLHPPDRVIAYLRYLPDPRGARDRAGVKYRKVYSLHSRTKLLAARWPEYLYRDPVFNREVQAVPFDNVKRHYLPTERFAELRRDVERDSQEQLAVGMGEILVREAGIPDSKVGVSGSILVALHTSKSDIDLILYGTDVTRKCYSRLRELLDTRSRGLSPHETTDLRRLYRQRGLAAAMSFETFARHERGKVLQGKFRGEHYFIRCVKEWDELQEVYGDRKYYPAGRVAVRATISDDVESILTPCVYQITNVEVSGRRADNAPSQVVSFRGRFCEQARNGERVLARGRLERVIDERGEMHRLVIGENPRDCLVVGNRE